MAVEFLSEEFLRLGLPLLDTELARCFGTDFDIDLDDLRVFNGARNLLCAKQFGETE